MTDEIKLSKNEILKKESKYLGGTLKESFEADTTHFTADEVQLLKFHGSYQQDDRDLRMELVKAKKEKAFSLMIRSKIPGGLLTAEQYLVHDEIADVFGAGHMRITDRQGIQFHGVLKKNLKGLIQALNSKLITTIGACGDVVRNVMAPAIPFKRYEQFEIHKYAKEVSDQFLWTSGTYHEIWLDGEKVDFNRPVEEVEPIYGDLYLPRKFKIGIAFPGDNSVDVYTHDLGIVPEIVDEKLTGFNILVGGGLGMTHGIAKTYPRLGTPLCFVKPEELKDISRAVVLVQRDYGNRSDRKIARLKYLIDERGLEWFKSEVDQRFGKTSEAPHEFDAGEIEHYHGWHEQGDGKWIFGLYVQNGRVKDEGDFKLKTALKTLAQKIGGRIVLTPEQDIVFADIEESQKEEVEAHFKAHGVKLPEEVKTIHKNSIACPAYPTCGLAISESERVIGDVLDDVHEKLESLGLQDEKITMRMTGCPNGCARPYAAEVAFVGRSVGTYNVYLGGSHKGSRLNAVVGEKIAQADVANFLEPVFKDFKANRSEGERFGDYCARLGVEKLKGLASV